VLGTGLDTSSILKSMKIHCKKKKVKELIRKEKEKEGKRRREIFLS
jgi:hypothetical protein